MMTKIYLLAGFFFITYSLSAQNDKNYAYKINLAQELFEKQEFVKAADQLESAFESKNHIPKNDRYMAAQYHALAGNLHKAFIHLFYLAEKPLIKYDNVLKLKEDDTLVALHASQRWNTLLHLVTDNKTDYEKNIAQPWWLY